MNARPPGDAVGNGMVGRAPHPGTAAPLAVRGLTVLIADKTVCDNLDIDFEAGQCWAVLGRNGVGKTTLLHTLAGVRPAQTGTIFLGDTEIGTLTRRRVAQRLGLLPQDHSDPFPARVLETALAGRHPHLAAWQWEGPADIAKAREALARVDLEGLESRTVDSLSGGERRRLGLATVLTQDPEIFLLDEPVNHLDVHHQIELLGQMCHAARTQGRTVVMTLHDLNLVARYCNRILMLFGDGEALHGPAEQVMTDEHLGRLLGHPIRHIDAEVGPLYFPA